MTTTSPTSTSPLTQAPGQTRAAAPGGRGTLSSTFDGFLKLLSAQLQHQDPLSPLDATQFTNQLVQFTTVEQAVQTNKQLGRLTDLIEGNRLTDALGFIGLDVAYSSDRVRLTAQGEVGLAYELPRPAEKVALTVRDEAGAVVRRIEAPAGGGAAGAHEVAWDGLRDDGRRAEPGLYRVEVAAEDASGAPVEVGRAARGRVEGVETGGDGGLRLTIGGVPVPLDDVRAARRPAATTATAAATAAAIENSRTGG